MTWDASAREYDIAFAEFPQAPVWPEDVTLESVLRSAFGKSCIEEWDHPVLRRHRGEAL